MHVSEGGPLAPVTPQPDLSSPAAIASEMRRALELHRQGKLEEAEAIYRAVLTAMPADFDALHLWGIAEYQLGRNEEAIVLFDRAIAVGPNDVFGHFNRALALTALK